MTDMAEPNSLEIFAVIGFDGSTVNGLNCHPDGVHIVYSIGDKICIQDWETKKMFFLSGHSNVISTLAVSSSGKYIGSGQINHIGFKSPVILWDYEKRTVVSSHELHKVRVESLAFTCDESLMISLGGRDCGQIIVWDIEIGFARWTTTATKKMTGDAVTLATMQTNLNSFVTAGDGTLRVWKMDLTTKSLTVQDVPLGKLKRYIVCVAISKDDRYAYCGTMSGDIIKMSIRYDDATGSLVSSMSGCFAKCGKWKKGASRPEIEFYSAGVHCILILDEELIIVGAGDGTVELLKEIKRSHPLPKTKLCSPVSPNFNVLKSKKLHGSITSIQMTEIMNQKRKENILMVGTKICEIYAINLNTFQTTLIVTCHNSRVTTIAFPKGMSDVFASAGHGDIRVWALKSSQELLRIQVANFLCTAVVFAADGKSIVSGWNDGCIRAFTPLTGRLMYCILNAHNKGTSAVALTDDGKTLISGGCEGQVRVWSIQPCMQTMKAVLKEHKCPVAAIKVNHLNTEAVSAGTDGTCIIWDIINLCRRQVMFANTVFNCICYEPTSCQILTGGSDRRVAYWEAGTGELAREVEASKKDSINALDINATGDLFVTGDNDQKVKLWKYREGIYTHLGIGHSGTVTSAKFSSDSRFIVSGSGSGNIFIWKCPQDLLLNSSRKNSAKQSKELERIPLKLGPNKDENISTMNTSRSSVITSCPCTCERKTPENTAKQGDVPDDSCRASCSKKGARPSPQQEVCRPPVSVKDSDLASII